MGNPKDNGEVWKKQNPLDNVQGLDAPLRIHHGINDNRVSVSQARSLKKSLLQKGYEEHEDFEYCELEDQGHTTKEIQKNSNEITQIIDFLTRHI